MLPGTEVDSIYRSMFAAYPDALLLVDGSGAILMANPAACELLGYSTDELARLSVDALVPDVVRARHAEYRAAYAHEPRARPMGTQELVARRRDGREVMVEIALSPLPNGTPPLVVAAMRGIASYPRVKLAMQRARYSECVAEVGRLAVDARDPQTLFHQLPELCAAALHCDVVRVFLLEPDLREFRVAAGVGGIPGEAVGARVPNRIDTPPGYVVAHGRPVIIEDYKTERRFAVPAAYLDLGLTSALAVPLSDRGRMIGALSARSREHKRFGVEEQRFMESLANLLASTVQRAESEEALNHAQRLESVGQLTGGIAHDFNNLLTIIQGNLLGLQRAPELQSKDLQDSLLSASRAASRAGELTGKLLTFSRRQVLQPARVDPSPLLRSLAEMLQRTIDQRVLIQVDVEADCPSVHADPGQLESALLNIAINARDAMPEGGVLSFKARIVGENVALAVTDTGVGMPEEVRERAFEPFFTTKAKGRGTGLGLSTVYGFVKQSKGTVEIDTAPGRGTTVTLQLPRWQPADAGGAGGEAAAGAELPRHLRVLMVEDEPEVRKVLGTFLTQLGIGFATAADGEQAMAWLESDGDLDLLLTDIALGPGMRGTDLAQRAQQRDPDLAVLLMSGFASELQDAGSEQPLPWELLRKPCTPEELAAALARALATAARGPD